MSGRLIILPKKSYCPWNPDNVARVERDEQQHRDRIERQQHAQAQRQGQERRQALVVGTKQQQRRQDYRKEEPSLQHVNLFQAEETEAVAATHCRLEHSAERPCIRSSMRRTNASGYQPFYLDLPVTRGGAGAGAIVHSRNDLEREQARKVALDPAMAFMLPRAERRVEHCQRPKEHAFDKDSCRHRRHGSSYSKHERRRTRRRRRNDDDDDESCSDNMEARKHRRRRETKTPSLSQETLAELSRRRQERESTEQSRQEALLMNDTTSRRYNDQFHPALAR